MQFKFKALAAAAVLAVSGQASAALSGDSQSNGNLFLTVWDIVTNESYVRDLGVALDSFLPAGALVSESGANRTAGFANFAGSSLFTGVFGNNTASNLRWIIVGVDNTEEGNTGLPSQSGSRAVTTISNTSAFNPAGFVNGAIRGVAANSVNFQGELINNGNAGLGDGSVTEFTSVGTGATEGGGPGWGVSLAGATPADHSGTGFGTAQFWFGQTTNDFFANDANVANNTRFGNSANFATFSLASDGSVTYNLDGAAVVPLPAAAWMMGAGLLTLIGAARRRQAAAAAA